MIRYKRLVLLLTPLVLIWASTHFFLDRALETAIEKAGSAANGARVDVGGVHTSFWGLSAKISRVQVADANAPMTNALEIGALRLDLAARPLFWKKFVVEKAEISGIQTGTARRSSGALPAAKAEKESQPGAAGQAPSAVAENLKTQYDPSRLITLDSLSSYQKIQEEKDHFAAASKDWQSKVDGLDVDGVSQRAKAFSEKVRGEKFSGGEGIKKAQQLLSEGKDLKADFDKTRRNFDAAKNSLQAEIARSKNALAEIERLKNQDIEERVDFVKSGLSTEGVLRGLIGPVWYNKMQTSLGTFQKVRRLMPNKKKDAAPAPPPPARKGTDIPFPFHYHWPAFLLKEAALSGVTPGDAPLQYGGTLKDVSSDPALLGRPITVVLDGKTDRQSLHLSGVLDYTQDTARESVDLTYRGLPLTGVKLGDLGGPVSIAKGVGVLNAKLAATGGQMTGRIDVTADPLKLSAPTGGDKKTAVLQDILARVNKGGVGFLISGTITAPRVRITSTLDNEINGAAKQAAQKEIDALRAKVRARVNELVDGDKSELAGDIDGKAGPAAEKLGAKGKSLDAAKEQIQKAVDQITQKGTGGASPEKSLKKLFKKK